MGRIEWQAGQTIRSEGVNGKASDAMERTEQRDRME